MSDPTTRLAEALTGALERLGLDDMTEHEDRLDVARAVLLPVVNEIARGRAAELVAAERVDDVVLDSRIIVGGSPFQLQVDATGWSIHAPEDCPHSPRCRGHRKSGDPEWTATEMACGRSDDDVETRVCDECVLGDEDPAPWCDCRGDETCGDRGPCRRRAHSPDDCPQLAYLDSIIASEPQEPVEGVLLGRDFTDAAVQRLHPDAAALASLHRPVFGRPPYCWACTSAGRAQVDSSRRVSWPCSTAGLALEMMGLTASDISIADRKE